MLTKQQRRSQDRESGVAHGAATVMRGTAAALNWQGRLSRSPADRHPRRDSRDLIGYDPMIHYLAPPRSRAWTNRLQSIETAIAHLPSVRKIDWPW